jgi:hypothetical protein
MNGNQENDLLTSSATFIKVRSVLSSGEKGKFLRVMMTSTRLSVFRAVHG